MCDENGKIISVNQAFEDVCGFNPMFHPFDAALPLELNGEPGSRGKQFSIFQALNGETLRSREVRLCHEKAEPILLLLTASPIKASFGVAGCVLTLTDITEHNRTEAQLYKLNRTLKALNASNEALLRADDEKTLLERVCKIITEDCGHAMVWIGFAENDEAKSVVPVAYSGFDEGYIEKLRITWADTERGRGPSGTAIRTGRPCMCRNMLTDPAFLPWREEALKRGYASSLVVPLMANGKAFGTITIYSREPDPFSKDEVALLAELADDLSYGLGALRLRAAHARAEEALRKSEERYRNLFNTMDEGFCIVEMIFDAQGRPADYRFLEVNTAFEKQTGLHEAEGKLMRDLAPEHEAHWFEIYGRIALTGEPAHFVEQATALDRWFEVYAYRIGEPEKRQVAIIFNDISQNKRAEEMLRRDADLMRLSFDAIVVWRLDSVIESWNRGAEQLYGYSESEAVGQVTHHLLKTIFPAPWPEIEAKLRKFGQWEGELRHTTKDGRQVIVSARKQLIARARMAWTACWKRIATLPSASARKKHFCAAEKLASVGRMASTIAHEINNPLETIGHAVYLALTDPETSQQASRIWNWLPRNSIESRTLLSRPWLSIVRTRRRR